MSTINFKSLQDSYMKTVTESITWFKKPQQRYSRNSIDGKDGAKSTKLGYAPLSIPAVIGLKKDANIEQIITWLNGPGPLICSDDPLKYRNAEIFEQIDYDKLVRFKKVKVDFFCEDPYRYLISDPTVTKTTFPALISYLSNIPGEPLLKVYGSGTVTIGLNTTVTYTFDTPYVYIDCASKEVYYTEYELKNNNAEFALGSDNERLFPKLTNGSNWLAIISGTVTQVDITPRTRFL